MVHEPDYTISEWVDVPGLTLRAPGRRDRGRAGLRLLPTPGHTAGHQSLVVGTDEGTVVLAGQSVQTRAEWLGIADEATSGEHTAADPAAYARSVGRLRATRSGARPLRPRSGGLAARSVLTRSGSRSER